MKTQVTQFNLYVDGFTRGASVPSHRVYDLGSNTTGVNPFDGFTLEDIRQMDMVSSDFVTVEAARLEVSTTTTYSLSESRPVAV